MAKKGSRGTYQGRNVEVTHVNDNGTLNVVGIGSDQAPFTADNIAESDFTPTPSTSPDPASKSDVSK